ncbi:FecR family protein [Sunxiuqinia sp. A32]|uniref:FecR family protein n=1 Tax=Sunxiuqinia sp. A32 TaxID=3461496 RepID=UPI004045F0F0
MNKKKKNVSDQQLFHFLNNTANEEDIQQVKNWIRACREHKAYFDKFKQAFDTADSYELYKSINVDNQWESFNQNTMNKTEKRGLFYLKANLVKIAAAFILIFGASFLVYYLSSPKLLVYEFSEANPFVHLPDSSIIYLKPDAKVTTHQQFDRGVSLEGEAFFFVKSNPEQIFTVNLKNSKIQVHGTTFRVNTGIKTKVELYEGNISFITPVDTVDLKVGNGLTYNPKTNEIDLEQSTDTATFIHLRDADLKEVCKVLEQRYQYKITISPGIRNIKFTFSITPTTTLTEILKILRLASPLDFTIEDRHITIKPKEEEVNPFRM